MLAPYEKSVSVAGDAGETATFMSPLKIFEYMSWSKAILCSDLPVLREVLADGANAILIPPDNLGAWRDALARLIREPETRLGLGRAARRDFIARHTWRRRARFVLEF